MIREPYVGQKVSTVYSPSWRGTITEIVLNAEPRFPELYRVQWEESGGIEVRDPIYARAQLQAIEPEIEVDPDEVDVAYTSLRQQFQVERSDVRLALIRAKKVRQAKERLGL